ncbi:hypothetical protein [Marinitenerispora sediminis]|uniref:Alpha/beta hydrolase n=1 Tax=Marinitenerispora sediminis TaxID=1931232 RepID=A0A368T8I6_9ACTN|nr:hypothetical protein [Marinitenerispora sediminis]RCV51367.1 hypothetical protein DEF28_15705 [Marinitenerispora sediminis]RCV57195.1 hypothetical protein DEF23_11280 [Marinitenerispora sediminis]RCV60298.1 hypothetical protein DEF24_07420 [Marinitenerispora sediminis]
MIASGVVLLHSPLADARVWGALPERLAARAGRPTTVVVPAVEDDDRPPYAARYVARAALEITRADPAAPVLLVAAGSAGPLLPAIGAAQRAAHRRVAGYLLADALLPQPGRVSRADLAAAQTPEHAPAAPDATGAATRPPEFFTEPLPTAADWPDAPCGYLLTDPRYARCARLAELRGWPVVTAERDGGPDAAAAAMLELAALM